MSPDQPFNLRIEKIVSGGFGLGRCDDGKVVLVPGVLPDEEVVVVVEKIKKGFLQCGLVSVETASPYRVSPACPVYGDCGGCNFQHIEYQQQVYFKQAILTAHLLRNHVVQNEEEAESLLLPLSVSENQFAYRLRIRLHHDASVKLGIYRYHSKQVVPLETCHISCQEINDILVATPKCPSFQHLLARADEVEILVSPDDRACTLFLQYRGKPGEKELGLIADAILALPGVKDIYLSVDKKMLFNAGGKVGQADERGLLSWTLPAMDGKKPITLTIEPGGFYQVNKEQNEKLLSYLLELADLSGKELILDLFCGMGNFSLPLAAGAAYLVGMDIQGSAIRSAKRNARSCGLTNTSFKTSSALNGAAKLARSRRYFDLILLDPPRSGCRDILPHIVSLGPEKILYVSCDPATLCRDLAYLVLSGHYALSSLRVIDMFPQTSHMETLACLVRK